MALTTWDGSADEHWDEDLNWDTGTAPTSADDVVIPDASTTPNDPELTGASPKNVLSIKVETGGIIVGAGSNIRAYGENSSGMVADFDGEISGVLSLQIKTSATTSIDLNASSGNIEHLHLDSNGDDLLVNSENTCELNGNLIIEKGEFNANGNVLIVDGKTTIGDASHSAEDEATLTCAASLLTLGSGNTDDYAIEMLAGGTFAGGTANHTTGAIKQTVANTKFTFTAATTTINSEYTTADRMFELTAGKVYNADGRITLSGNFTSCIQWTGPSGDTGPHTLRINDASLTVKPRNTLYVEENLNIDAGTFNTQYDGSDKTLTVTGSIMGVGTLICNSSTVTVAANGGDIQTIITGAAPTIQGAGGAACNVVGYNGAVTFTGAATITCRRVGGAWSAGTSTVNLKGTGHKNTQTGSLYNLVVDSSGQTFRMGSDMTITNDLTITNGTLTTNSETDGSGSDYWLKVTRDVNINGSSSILTTNGSQVIIGALSTTGSGIYNATTHNDGTVINSRHSVLGRGLSCGDSDSYVHKTGKTVFKGSAVAIQGILINGEATSTVGLNDVEINSTADFDPTLMGPIEIYNDLTITAGELSTHSTQNYALTVTGDVTIANGSGLVCNSSVVSVNSITISANGTLDAPDASGSLTLNGTLSAWSFQNNSTNFNHNNGTVTQTNAGHIKSVNANPFYNFIMNSSSSDSHEASFRPKTGTDCVIAANDVTITRGVLRLNTTSDNASMGSLTIGSTGTYQASSGTTTNNGDLENNGTYTHNDGIYKNAVSGKNIFGTSETAFYKIDAVARLLISVDTTVEHSIYNTGGSGQIRFNGLTSAGGMTLTMGKSGTAGSIDVGFLGMWNNNCTTKIYAADQVKPWTVSAGTNWQFGVATGELWHLKWGDVDPDITTSDTYSNAKTITLDGDMEFDAVTVSSGDTLDLGGQRAEFSGEFRNNGTMNSTGGGLMICHSNLIQTGVAEYMHDGDVNVIAYGGVGNDYSLGIGNSPSGPWARNLMINDDVTSNAHFGDAWNRFSPENIIVGNGTFTMANSASFATDITVANGGTFVPPSSNTITCSGNFNIAGGLIGNTALTYDGTNDVSWIPDMSQISGLALMTVEAWAKYDTDTSGYSYICRKESEYQLGIDNSGYFYSYIQDAGGTDREVIGTVDLRDGKWHHFAMVWDGSKAIGYLDGKLVGETAGSTGAVKNSSYVLSVGCRDADGTCSSFFKGTIGLIQIWNDVRTPSEIRGGMFTKYDNTEAGLAGSWQMDYYNATQIQDVEENGYLTLGAATGGTGGAGANPPSFVGAGGFTDGSSTLDFTGNGSWYVSDTTTEYNNVKVAASGKTTTLVSVGAGERRPKITGLLTHGGGTFDDVNSADIVFSGAGTHTAGADLSGLYVTYWASSANNPGGTYKYFITQTNHTLGGSITATGYLGVGSGYTFNTGDNDMTLSRWIAYADCNINVGSSTVTFTGDHGFGSTSGQYYSGRTFSAGPGATIIGYTGGTGRSAFTGDNNFTVVGKIENLDVMDYELNVTGQVINCTGEIHQWHNTIDSAQQLDRDTADDRDVNLGRDLDKNTELVG